MPPLRTMSRVWPWPVFLLMASPALAAECREEQVQGNSYVICDVDMAREDLRLFLYDKDSDPFGYFGNVTRALEGEGKVLGFAMNAGMYHDDRRPVGHYIEEGKEFQKVISSAGPGNFGLLPNGVLCLQEGRADVMETIAYLDAAPDCRFATQSGPMLVIDGALHPRFLVDGTSRYLRNGVGTSADGQTVTFAISDNPVNFHEFGSLFRDHLQLDNALFLDGNISRIHAPDLGRSGAGFTQMGPIIGVVEPAD